MSKSYNRFAKTPRSQRGDVGEVRLQSSAALSSEADVNFEKKTATFQAAEVYGLTLVEVIIAMGIATVVGALLLVIIVNSAGLFYQQSSKIEQGLGANDALAKIRSSIKEAQSIASGYPEGSPTYTSGATQLVLKLPSIDSSGNIILSTFDYFVFLLDQTKLRFKVFPAGTSTRKSVDQIFSTNASNLEFKYLNLANPPVEVLPTSASKVKITLSLKQKSGRGYEQSVATSEANLRND